LPATAAARNVASIVVPAFAASAGVATWCPICPRYTDDMMLPSTAMPSAPPSSRDRSLTAEPTPDLARGTDDMMSVVDGAVVCPLPNPISTKPTNSST